MDYRVVADTTFTDPQFTGIGYTEREARKSRIQVKSTIVPFSLIVKAELAKDTRVAIKSSVRKARTGFLDARAGTSGFRSASGGDHAGLAKK